MNATRMKINSRHFMGERYPVTLLFPYCALCTRAKLFSRVELNMRALYLLLWLHEKKTKALVIRLLV